MRDVGSHADRSAGTAEARCPAAQKRKRQHRANQLAPTHASLGRLSQLTAHPGDFEPVLHSTVDRLLGGRTSQHINSQLLQY